MHKRYSRTHIYDIYGMFWGISTVAVLLFGVLFGFGALKAVVLSAVVLGLFYKANKIDRNC